MKIQDKLKNWLPSLDYKFEVGPKELKSVTLKDDDNIDDIIFNTIKGLILKKIKTIQKESITPEWIKNNLIYATKNKEESILIKTSSGDWIVLVTFLCPENSRKITTKGKVRTLEYTLFIN